MAPLAVDVTEIEIVTEIGIGTEIETEIIAREKPEQLSNLMEPMVVAGK